MRQLVAILYLPVVLVKLVWSLVQLGIELAKICFHLGRLALLGLRYMGRVVRGAYSRVNQHRLPHA